MINTTHNLIYYDDKKIQLKVFASANRMKNADKYKKVN